MAATPLKGMRIWVAFITFVSLAVTVGYYSFIDFHYRKAMREENLDELVWASFALVWQDYVLVITSVLLFLIYISSLFVNRRLVPSKFLRAFLILIPTAFFLYVHANNITIMVRLQNKFNDARRESYMREDFYFEDHNWLVCQSFDTLYYLDNSRLLLGIITGLFVIVEVVMAFVMSPQPAKTVDF